MIAACTKVNEKVEINVISVLNVDLIYTHTTSHGHNGFIHILRVSIHLFLNQRIMCIYVRIAKFHGLKYRRAGNILNIILIRGLKSGIKIKDVFMVVTRRKHLNQRNGKLVKGNNLSRTRNSKRTRSIAIQVGTGLEKGNSAESSMIFTARKFLLIFDTPPSSIEESSYDIIVMEFYYAQKRDRGICWPCKTIA